RSGHHVPALRGVAPRPPGRGGRRAHHHDKCELYVHPARLRRAVRRRRQHVAGVLAPRGLPSRRRLVRAPADRLASRQSLSRGTSAKARSAEPVPPLTFSGGTTTANSYALFWASSSWLRFAMM